MGIFRFFVCLFLLALNSSIYALDNDQASSEIITMTGAAYGGDVWVLDINYPISKTITYVAGSIANGKNILNAANGFAAQINADPDALQILTALAVDSDEGYSAEVHLQMIEGVDGFDASVSVIGNNDRELSVSITNNLNLDETDSDGYSFGTNATGSVVADDELSKDVVELEVLEYGNFEQGYVSFPYSRQDFSTTSSLEFQVLDQQGENTVYITLVDDSGASWSSWSSDEARTVLNAWTTIEFDYSAAASVINLTQIAEVRLALWNAGSYRFADLAHVTSAVLDIDANGSFDALTDGLIILRYAFGLRGQSLIDGVISQDANRTQAADIEAYIETLLP